VSALSCLPARVAILSAAGALISLAAATPMAFATATVAAEDDVDVVNTETVQVYMDAEGDILSRRVYEQLVLTGQGSVDIENPISENNLRNLDGFSGFTVEDGNQITAADVDGVERLRTVSDYDGKLPLDVDIAYKLDGKSVEPGDIVGNDGELEVEFTVTNVTGEEQEITVPDGKGGTLTKTATVPLPIVGSLTTFGPANFTDVRSDQANMAGDGKGGTKLSFTIRAARTPAPSSLPGRPRSTPTCSSFVTALATCSPACSSCTMVPLSSRPACPARPLRVPRSSRMAPVTSTPASARSTTAPASSRTGPPACPAAPAMHSAAASS
jgi:hypothetical protein